MDRVLITVSFGIICSLIVINAGALANLPNPIGLYMMMLGLIGMFGSLGLGFFFDRRNKPLLDAENHA